ncbi:MAG: extracellular solute-binding protein [Oscillospiraceae bacterium]|nr:extracellular solute-binding protein [Oscillospiraceae bacterium]
MKRNVLTRALCILLLLSLAAVFAACGSDDEPSAAGSVNVDGSLDGDTESTPDDTPAPLFSNLPNTNFDGADFVVLVNGDSFEQYASVEVLPQESSDSGLQDAVKARNDLIEEHFGVTIKENRTEAQTSMVSIIRNNAVSGVSEYDLVMPYMSDAATLAMEGLFFDLAKTEHIHLNESYYDQGAVSGLSVANKNYFATGDLSLLSFACTHAMIFNKDMIEENGMENPYDLVENGEWTIDKLQEMARKVTTESDGNPGWGYGDTYGFLVNGNFAGSMFVGAGHRFTSKNEQDEPVISITDSGAVSTIEKITALINDKSATAQIVDGSDFYTSAVAAGKNVWTTANEVVANKTVLFRAIALIDVFDMGKYECKFGVLPTPKLDTAQEKYYNRVSTLYASCVAIPINVADPTMSAVITDALMQASTDTIKKAYFEVIMKGRKIADLESEKMLDIIFDSRVYDLGSIYNWGGNSEYDTNSITGFLNDVAFSSTKEFTSTWEGIADMVQSAMEDTIDAYRSIPD